MKHGIMRIGLVWFKVLVVCVFSCGSPRASGFAERSRGRDRVEGEDDDERESKWGRNLRRIYFFEEVTAFDFDDLISFTITYLHNYTLSLRQTTKNTRYS